MIHPKDNIVGKKIPYNIAHHHFFSICHISQDFLKKPLRHPNLTIFLAISHLKKNLQNHSSNHQIQSYTVHKRTNSNDQIKSKMRILIFGLLPPFFSKITGNQF